MVKDVTDTRQLILHAALKRFADAGYAATSVQHIVDDAKVSKPRSIIISRQGGLVSGARA
jgi:AcrR family transcriptional regulator